jgi:hypothetical protein
MAVRLSAEHSAVPGATVGTAGRQSVQHRDPHGVGGGEAVKAWLIRPYVSLTESLAPVVGAKTTITIGQAVYLLLGLLVGAAVLPSKLRLLQVIQWLLGLELVGVGGSVAVRVLGVLGTGRGSC